MKSLILASVLVLGSATAFAEHEMGKTFEERKAHMTKEIEERLTALNGHKSCVSAATDDAGLKACHEKMQDVRMENRMERMEKRKEHMEKRMDKMKDKMNK